MIDGIADAADRPDGARIPDLGPELGNDHVGGPVAGRRTPRGVEQLATGQHAPLLGDQGRHARTAVGVNVLPFNLAVEVDGIFEVR